MFHLKLKVMKNRRLFFILAGAALLLSVPLIAMQFTPEVDWDVKDFLIMGVLLLGTGTICELVLRTVKNKTHRLLICVGVLLAFFLIWAELAVGIFGSPFAGS